MLVHSWHMISAINTTIDENCKQQNATDFTCDEIAVLDRSIEHPAIFKDRTQHNKKTNLPITSHPNGSEVVEGWYLKPGIYETKSNIWVEIPADCAAWVVQRSSLNRNGVVLMGSLYDSGYNGPICSTIYVHNPNGIFIEKGARVGQFILAKAEALGQYNGQYQSEKRT